MELLKAGPKKIIGQFKFRGGLGHQQQFEYDMKDIMNNLRIDFRQKVLTTNEFWAKLNEDINKANQMMGSIRITLPQQNVLEKLKDKDDNIFKYKVYLYGRNWT